MIEKKKDRPLKRLSGLLILFFLALSLETFADEDTSKGETRLVPKESENYNDDRTEHEKRNNHNAYGENADDDDDCYSWSCLIGNVLKFIFIKPVKEHGTDDEMIRGALECLEKFGEQFTAENLEGMDEHLHFPHILLSGSNMVIWEKPGQLPADFFENLKKGGWRKTVTQSREVILVSADKVHFRVKYTRENSEGKVLSAHDNVWIVTRKNGKWGIVLRSY